MAVSKKSRIERVKHTMELDDDIELHTRGWKVQRVAWVLILILVLAGALGFFGEGVVSKKKVTIGGSQFKYDRFFRYEAEMTLQFTITDVDTPARISFSQDYIKYFRIQQIVPEPKENFTRSGKVFYVFNGALPMEVTFYIASEKPGSLQGEVGVNDANYHLSQFIYP